MNLKNFGFRLKNAIQSSNYTQKEISEILKISQDTLTNYVKEKSYPNIDILHKICVLIDKPMEWIIYEKEKKDLTEHEEKLIENFRILNERNQIKTEGYIEGLLREQQMLYVSESTEKEEEKIDTG